MIRIVEPSIIMETPVEWIKQYPEMIERFARVCYRSEDRITDDSAGLFVRRLIANGHESVIEHCSITVRIVCDRNTSHQIVRHRLSSFSQESQRYCKYFKELPVIIPEGIGESDLKYSFWYRPIIESHFQYKSLIDCGVKKEIARSVLPGCTATEIVWTANLREWRHILKLRCNKKTQLQFRKLMLLLREELKTLLPCIFGATDV